MRPHPLDPSRLPQDATWEDVRRRVDEVAGADTVALLKILARAKQQIKAGKMAALDDAVAQVNARIEQAEKHAPLRIP